MRIESSVTAVSWIPMEAVQGMAEMPFSVGVAHYDQPPPEVLEDVEGLIAADGAREANELRAYIEVADGKIVDYGHIGRGHIGFTKINLGLRDAVFPAVALPLLRPFSRQAFFAPARRKSRSWSRMFSIPRNT